MDSSSEANARTAFARWAALQKGAPGDAGSLVQSVEEGALFAGILTTTIEGRRLVWKSVPSGSKARITVPAIRPEFLDPWNVDAATIRASSDHIAICTACNGAEKVTCGVCRGSGRATCPTCNGQRKMYGYASNGSYRLLNCTNCRGKGELDCAHCRRGIAACPTCGGEGRLQRWIELEWWKRAETATHPEAVTRQLGWDYDADDEMIRRDAEVVRDIERPHRLTSPDLAGTPAEWVTRLAPQVHAGERIVRQRLRIGRLPTHTIHYVLGGRDEELTLTGRRFLAPRDDRSGPFARRHRTLSAAAATLFIVLVVIGVVSLARGPFYWNAMTLASIAAFAAALGALFGAIADWTATRRRTMPWLAGAAGCAAIALALAFAALPRTAHVEKLIARGELANAEAELRALGANESSEAWGALHLARIAAATNAVAARHELTQIPATSPLYARALGAADDAVLREAEAQAQQEHWRDLANTLRLLSGPRPQAAALVDQIRNAALRAADEAKGEADAQRRLRLRVAAEELFVAWERATGQWGTPQLIALRTAMARDLALAEKGR